MRKTVEHNRQYVILESNRARYARYVGSFVRVCSTQAEISKIYDETPQDLTWITTTRKSLDELLKTASRHRAKRPGVRRDECVITVASPRAESMPTLRGLFSHIVGDSSEYRWLSKDELSDVLFGSATDRSEHFIAAASDPVTQTISLVRGDCHQLVLPFSFFEPSGDGTTPDFSKPRVVDFGRTVLLGEYEASADVILYETAPEYRKKVNESRKESEKSFGASLCRLRKQRKLKRSNFLPLSAKTIARIERNEVARPQGKTLKTIANRLGVPPEEIGTY
jgi:hypothetical protein